MNKCKKNNIYYRYKDGKIEFNIQKILQHISDVDLEFKGAVKKRCNILMSKEITFDWAN